VPQPDLNLSMTPWANTRAYKHAVAASRRMSQQPSVPEPSSALGGLETGVSATQLWHRPPVVLMTNGFGHGGTEDHVLQVGRGLARRGVPVAAILSAREDLRWLATDLRREGVRVHLIRECESPLDQLHLFSQLVGILRHYQRGILHFHYTMFWSGKLPLLAARVAGVHTIVRTDHNPPFGPLSTRQRQSLRIRDALLHKVIVVSQQDRTAYAKEGRDPKKMAVVAHGVDVHSFGRTRSCAGALRTSLGIRPDEVVVGNVGNLSPAKGTRQFIEMAALLVEHAPAARIRFLVVGRGTHLNEYRAHAARLGLSERIVFTGQIAKEQIPDYLATMDLFVLPSLVESGPYTALEAIASGIPVVATAVGMMPELIEDHVNGRVVPPGDAAALACAVTEVLDLPDRGHGMAHAARDVVLRTHSEDAMIDRILRVYYATVSSDRRRSRWRSRRILDNIRRVSGSRVASAIMQSISCRWKSWNSGW
jgi:glycosyltransferase involved in cell wall biosynthesis